MENEIAICGRDIDADVSTVFNEKTLRDDEALINCILEYGETIKNNCGEIFKHEKNIIATSEGYFFAFYVSELTAV
jgi:hypothetical protein